jgi:peptidoglycan/LPS O-acetylase OafA/YrhL
VTATSLVPAQPRHRRRQVVRRRQDIQALRAVAVSLVLLFHLWPARMTGGYVGVDVFFVISGFLITSHLVKSPPRSMRDIGAFWARRIRRLLPAAFAVIAATAVASWAFLPESQWRSLARDAIASAIYVENWNLAGSATDYLAADGASSPFQQFWSLSVEEQFYIVWPLLVAAAVALAARRAASVTWAVGVVVGLVLTASLAASVLITVADPEAAYFVTHTRMWELALGGVLAVATAARPGWFSWPGPVRAAVAWAALAAIGWSAFTLTGSTPFPGTAALVPTLAAVAFIAARSESGAFSPQRISATVPVQYVGDVSYSVYLWHWPIIVILPYVTGQPLSWALKLAIIAVTLVVAGASKRWIEDPPQKSAKFARLPWAAGFAAAGMVGVIALGGAQTAYANAREHQAAADLAAALEAEAACAGAAAMVPGAECAHVPHGAELLTTPAQAAADRPAPYADGCWTSPPFDARNVCTYGDADDPAARIALVGNSHAGHWLPALEELADDYGWQIDTYLVSECFPVDMAQNFAVAGASEGCRAWGRWAVGQTAGAGYDLVVTSARSGPSLTDVAEGDQVATATSGYLDVLSQWTTAGDRVLVLRDTPYGEVVTPDCIAEHITDLSACDGPQDRREVPDPLADAARLLAVDTVQVADLTEFFCRDEQCYSTIGGLIVYFDRSHMTTAFAATLAPFVEPYATELLATETTG